MLRYFIYQYQFNLFVSYLFSVDDSRERSRPTSSSEAFSDFGYVASLEGQITSQNSAHDFCDFRITSFFSVIFCDFSDL